MFIYVLVYLFIGYLWTDLKFNILFFLNESEKTYDIIKVKWAASLLCIFFDAIWWPIRSVYYFNKLANIVTIER